MLQSQKKIASASFASFRGLGCIGTQALAVSALIVVRVAKRNALKCFMGANAGVKPPHGGVATACSVA